MTKKAIVTGITGQDGSYLAEFLLSMEYEVHGVVRHTSTSNRQRIDHLCTDSNLYNKRLFIHYADLSDSASFAQLIQRIKPDEIYNLAAQSHVRVSFDIADYTGDVTGLGTTRILDAIRYNDRSIKFYQASSSEMFGSTLPPQNELSIMSPQSPYAVAKLYSYWMVVNYRHGYNIFASNGILFNHESPRRGDDFVTRKITKAIGNILAGNQQKLYLGNIESLRDWGYAPEYVEAMWKILQLEQPDDYVIGTDSCYSVREFLEKAFSYVGITIKWDGKGIEEKGIIASVDDKYAVNNASLKPGYVLIEIDSRYFRPTEVNHLIADSSKARKSLEWKPKISFEELIAIMVDADIEKLGIPFPGEGKKILENKGLSWLRKW